MKPTPPIDSDWVIRQLQHIVEHCTDEAYQFNPAGAIRALELIGKHLGMFKEKHDTNGKDSGPYALNDAKAALLRGLIPDADDGRATPAD